MKSSKATPGVSERRSLRLVLFLLIDYTVIFALAGAVAALKYAQPFRQNFALQNYSLHYAYVIGERIPSPLLYTCCAVVPAVIVTIWTMAWDVWLEYKRAKRERRPRAPYSDGLWELNAGLLGLFLANSIAYVVTGILNNVVGKPRPDFLDRCQPNLQMDQFASPVYGLSNTSICTQKDESFLNDGFRSFPSGHSASSFAGLFYLTLYLAGKMHVLDHRGHAWKVFAVLVPTMGAALISATPLQDNRHHPSDVLAGTVLGVACAYIAYRQYFPSLSAAGQAGKAHRARRHEHSGHHAMEPWDGLGPRSTFEQFGRKGSLDNVQVKTELYGYDTIKEAAPSPQSKPKGFRQSRMPKATSHPNALPEPLQRCGTAQPKNPRDSLGGAIDPAKILRREYSPSPSAKAQSRSPPAQPSLTDISTSLSRRDYSPSVESRAPQPSPYTQSSLNELSRRDYSPGPPSRLESRSTCAPPTTNNLARRDRSLTDPVSKLQPRSMAGQCLVRPTYVPFHAANETSHPPGEIKIADKASLEAIRKLEFPGSPDADGPSIPIEMSGQLSPGKKPLPRRPEDRVVSALAMEEERAPRHAYGYGNRGGTRRYSFDTDDDERLAQHA